MYFAQEYISLKPAILASAGLALTIIAIRALTLMRFWLALCQARYDGLGATAGLSSSAENTVGQANRGTHQSSIDKALAGSEPPVLDFGF